MSVTSDKRLDVLKWQASIKLAKAARRWEASRDMWGLDHTITNYDLEQLTVAIAEFRKLQYK